MTTKLTFFQTDGSIGGHLQAGGHGPVCHTFSLATDQLLEYEVVLASGEVDTAGACHHAETLSSRGASRFIPENADSQEIQQVKNE